MNIAPARLELEIARLSAEHGARARFTCSVRGASMAPALVTGMHVTVEAADAATLSPGEIVCWLASGGTDRDERKVIHRLVRTERDTLGRLFVVTKGDAAGREDPPVPADRLLGRVVAVAGPSLAYRIAELARRAAKAAGRVVQAELRPLLMRLVLPRVRFSVEKRPDVFVCAATLFGRKVAFGACSRVSGDGSPWLISGVWTNRWLRGLGLATRICQELMAAARHARPQGARVVLLVFPDNRRAVRLYHRPGFARSADSGLEAYLTAGDPPSRPRVLLEWKG